MQENCTFTQRDYKVRPGTTNLGREYEYKMMALLLLRCVREYHDLWMASNAEGVGAFDDIVMRVRTRKGYCVTYLIQLKHKESAKPVTEKDFLSQKGDFSLLKYSADIAKIKESIDGKTAGIVGDLGKFNNLYFVIFTNSAVNPCKYLEKNSYSRESSVLNTGKGGGDVYKFKTDELPPFVEKGCGEYCAKINLFAKQINAKHLNGFIEAELQRLMRHLQLGHLQINTKSVTEDFTWYITEWAKGSLGGYYYLTKTDVVAKLSDLFLAHYELDLRLEQFDWHSSSQKLIWNRIVRNKTMTVVDYDAEVAHFLKLYVGSEIQAYIKEFDKNWGQNVPDEAQTAVFQNYANIKKPLLKLIGNYGKLTPYHLYKCLWLNGELPLVLQIVGEDDLDNVKKVLTLSKKTNLKIIVLNKSNDLAFESSTPKFVTLADIDAVERSELLKLSVELQGRSSVILEKVVDESMYNLVKCRDIINILRGDFSIGPRYEPLPQHYMQRSLFKVLLKLEVLFLDDEVFAITDVTNELLHVLTDISRANAFVIKSATEMEALKANNKSVHHLHFEGDNYFIWRGSSGSTKKILEYRLDDDDDEEVEDVFEGDDVLGTARIISECPGMGKSTTMNFISNEAPVDVWVLKVALNEHDEYYERLKYDPNLKAADHINYFSDALLKKYSCSNTDLAEAVLRKFLGEKKVLLLLDGFDEVCFLHKDEATALAKCLYIEGHRFWLTTRPHLRLHLEEQLNTIATTLKPFTHDDQMRFLFKYFMEVSKTVNLNLNNRLLLINQFVCRLLIAALKNLNDWHSSFMGIPLQTKLLADVFSKDLKASLQEGVISFNDQFNLVYLYEEFLKSKIEILCEKFGKDAKHTRSLFRSHQQLIALKFLFKEEQLHSLDIDRHIREFYESETDKEQFLQREGLIVIETSRRISFVHRTFAEYLAAQWLAENYGSTNFKIRKTVESLMRNRFNVSKFNYSFLFRMFDSILARQCPLHMLIINEHRSRAEAMIQAQPEVIDAVDEGGRTVLHIAALYGADQYTLEMRSVENHDLSDDLMHLIEQIPRYKISNIIKLDDLGYNPLDNAVASRSFTIANKICELAERISLNVYSEDRYNLIICLDNCFRLKYKSLFNAILEYFVCHDILFNRISVKEKTTLAVYYRELFTIVDGPADKYVNETSVTYISELLEGFNIKSPGDSYYYDLRFAIAFGRENNVKKLLMNGANVNERDLYHNAPLHYSVKNKQDSLMDILISVGAEVNNPGWKSNTALHLACKNGYKSAAWKLLSKGADINAENDDGDTPLLVALKNEHESTAKFLISMNASISVENRSGLSCLHYAAEAGSKGLVRYFVMNKLDVNKQNKKGDPPIFFALRGEHLGVARMLLDYGAEARVENCKEKTCLYYAARAGAKSIVSDLIRQGFDVNKQCKSGKTALFAALKRKHVDIANLFLTNGADVTLQSAAGNTALHVAAKYSCCELLRKLVFGDAHVNATNNKKETPLHQTVPDGIIDKSDAKRHFKVVEFLLSNGADINAQDGKGNSVLHYVGMKWWKRPHHTEEDDFDFFGENFATMFLNAGVDIGLKNGEGKTALDLALDDQNTTLAALIYRKILNPYCNLNESNCADWALF